MCVCREKDRDRDNEGEREGRKEGGEGRVAAAIIIKMLTGTSR